MYTAVMAITGQLISIAVALMAKPSLVDNANYWLAQAAILFLLLPVLLLVSRLIHRRKDDET